MTVDQVTSDDMWTWPYHLMMPVSSIMQRTPCLYKVNCICMMYYFTITRKRMQSNVNAINANKVLAEHFTQCTHCR